MEWYQIEGGHSLEGGAWLPPAKNSVMPLLAAAMLCDGPVTLEQVPRTADVQTSLKLLQALGVGAARRRGGVTVRPIDRPDSEMPSALAGAMRSSVFYLAPLLYRAGRVTMPRPGGCRLGPRPIDIHLDGLARMGACVGWQQNSVTLWLKRELKGADITLRLPSVGGTETLMMAGAVARGGTVLRGAACEPEVRDLGRFLNLCGADIHGAGTPIIRIRGRESLRGCRFTPLPDRMIGATLACGAACAGGRVTLHNARREDMADVLSLLEQAGCGVTAGEQGVTVEREGRLRGLGTICTGAWPGFSTDAAPLLAAALLQSEGETAITDCMFEKRFACAAGFGALGGKVRVEGRTLYIGGCGGLQGACLQAPDLRGGAALVLAALGAKGQSTVQDSGHIGRGYPKLEELLGELGAKVWHFRRKSTT